MTFTMAARVTMGALLGRCNSSHTSYTLFLAHPLDLSSSGATPDLSILKVAIMGLWPLNGSSTEVPRHKNPEQRWSNPHPTFRRRPQKTNSPENRLEAESIGRGLTLDKAE